jgi:hypothetical protein
MIAFLLTEKAHTGLTWSRLRNVLLTPARVFRNMRYW